MMELISSHERFSFDLESLVVGDDDWQARHVLMRMWLRDGDNASEAMARYILINCKDQIDFEFEDVVC